MLEQESVNLNRPDPNESSFKDIKALDPLGDFRWQLVCDLRTVATLDGFREC